MPAGSTTDANPTFARWALAAAVKRHRQLHEHGVDTFADILGVTKTQASKLGSGSRGLSIDQVEILAKSYELGASERDRLLALAEEAQKRSGWWQRRKLGENYRTLIGLEQASTSIREWCGDNIPGLLQHPDFAEAAIRAQTIGVDDEGVAAAAETRRLRQEVLDRPNPPQLSVIFDEASLIRVPNGQVGAMRLQLKRLLEAADRPNVTMRVIPFSAGMYPHLGPQMILMRLPEGLPTTLYAETATTTGITDDPAEIEQAERHWEALLGFATSAAQTVELIRGHLAAS